MRTKQTPVKGTIAPRFLGYVIWTVYGLRRRIAP